MFHFSKLKNLFAKMVKKMDSKNKPITKSYPNYYAEILCPHCGYMLAHGCSLGMTVTFYKTCPKCGKELQWDYKKKNED